MFTYNPKLRYNDFDKDGHLRISAVAAFVQPLPGLMIFYTVAFRRFRFASPTVIFVQRLRRYKSAMSCNSVRATTRKELAESLSGVSSLVCQ